MQVREFPLKLRPTWPATVDLLLVVAALLFAAVTLSYPFGYDQGEFMYVAQEWLRGSIPYRDVIEIRPPGTFVPYMVALVVGGDHMWAIRAFDIVGVVTLGWITGWLATAARERPQPGVRGTAVATLAVLYFGFFFYWDTAQVEMLYSGFIICAMTVVERGIPGRLTCLATGGLCGLAFLVKPVAAVAYPLILALLVERRLRNRHAWRGTTVSDTAWFVCGALLVGCVAIGYFALVGALPAALDVAFRIDPYYAQQGRVPVHVGLPELFETLRPALLLAAFVFVMAVAAWTQRRSYAFLRRYIIAGLLLTACLGAVILQHKFLRYHFAVLVPPLGLLAAYVADHMATTLPAKFVRRPAGALFPSGVAFGVLLAFGMSAAATRYAGDIGNALGRLTGRVSQQQFDEHFDIPGFYGWSDIAAVSAWLREHSAPNDLIVARGLATPVYILSGGRSAATRFFSSPYLLDSRLGLEQAEWQAEDRRDMLTRRPRYVAAVTFIAPTDLNSVAYYEPLGYVERFRHNSLAVLERATQGPTQVEPGSEPPH